ncbi:hypothetical protein GC194_09895 [bacterium]|nr:hypothetical protein [bacterium]
MIFYSVLALVMWLLNMAVTHYLSITIFSFSLAVLVPVFVVSLLVAKFVTAPIARIFASVEKNHEITNPIGKICEVQLTVRPGKLGQGIVTDLNGNVVRLNIVGQNQTIDKGTRTLVIEYQPQAKAYLVEPYNN